MKLKNLFLFEEFNNEYYEEIIDNKEKFKEYTYTLLKNAFDEDFDAEIADEMIDDICNQVENNEIDWSEAVGIVKKRDQ